MLAARPTTIARSEALELLTVQTAGPQFTIRLENRASCDRGVCDPRRRPFGQARRARRWLRDEEAAGSIPATPTQIKGHFRVREVAVPIEQLLAASCGPERSADRLRAQVACRRRKSGGAAPGPRPSLRDER